MGLQINKISDYYSLIHLNIESQTGKKSKYADVSQVPTYAAKPRIAGAAPKDENKENCIIPKNEDNKYSIIANCEDKRRDSFFSNYNDIISQNFGLLFDVKV